jgi:hypothetical protein
MKLETPDDVAPDCPYSLVTAAAPIHASAVGSRQAARRYSALERVHYVVLNFIILGQHVSSSGQMNSTDFAFLNCLRHQIQPVHLNL